jgi:hypothetical protein
VSAKAVTNVWKRMRLRQPGLTKRPVGLQGLRAELRDSLLRSRETLQEMLLHLFQGRKAFGHHELAFE